MIRKPSGFMGVALTTRPDPAVPRFAVLPIPYEGTVSYGKGTAKGPAAILDASRYVEEFDEELAQVTRTRGVVTLPPVRAASTPDAQMKRIAAAARAAMAGGTFVLSLGGEHSVTGPLVRAAADEHGEISVLQIDAHADLRDVYEGTRHSHACAMRRVLDVTPRLVQVGIRAYSEQETIDCPRQVASFITPSIVENDPRWIERALAGLGKKVYITIDVDGFDPAYVPGTGTPEPGGLTWRQVTALLRRVCAERRVVSADIVETAPIPGQTVSEFLAARLACKLLAYLSAKPGAAEPAARPAKGRTSRPRR